MKKRDWRKELARSRAKREKTERKLRKTLERKSKPSYRWSFEEKSNPDHEWLEFLRDIRLVLGREPEPKEARRVGRYLRPGRRYKNSVSLKRHERKRMRELICESMKAEEKVPGSWPLNSIYKSVKGKTKKELWK